MQKIIIKSISRSFILSILTLLMFSLSGCKPAKPVTKPVIPVNVIKLQTADVPISKEYIGVTSSMANVDIRARVEGFLQSSNFTEGSMVNKGQLLFVIDPDPFKAQLDEAQAELDQSIATADFDKLDAQRKKILYQQNAVSEQDSDQATANANAAVATVAANKANVEQAKINLSYCYIYSPIDGKIGAIEVDVGNLVGGTEQTVLANVVQLDPIYVSFNPSVNDYGDFLKYKTSDKPFKVEVTLPQQTGYTFKGEVDLVNNQVSTNTSTLMMRSIVQNPKNLLLPGLYVNVKLFIGTAKNALLVPSTAVMSEQTMQYVYTLNSANEVVATPIKVNMEYNNNWVVDSGLKAGDSVIINNLQKLRPGMKVMPTEITPTSSEKNHG